MKLTPELLKHKEWTIVGPMGPDVDPHLLNYPILAVDGGAHFCDRMKVWIGDGDSFGEKVHADHIFKFPPKKDFSDLALALSLFTDNSPLTLHLWGFLGGRKDHELLNYGEVLHFLESRPSAQVFFYDSHSQRVAVKCLAQGKWDLEHSGLFSLASIKNLMITLEGKSEYTLSEPTLLSPLSSLGLSNSASGKFSLTTDGPIMVFFPEFT